MPQIHTFTNPTLLSLDGIVAGTVTQTGTKIILSDLEVLQGEGVSHGANFGRDARGF